LFLGSARISAVVQGATIAAGVTEDSSHGPRPVSRPRMRWVARRHGCTGLLRRFEPRFDLPHFLRRNFTTRIVRSIPKH